MNPGLTETERLVEGLEADSRLHGISIDDARERSVSRIPLGRLAQPDEIAEAVLFLASPQASYITGVSVSMDGASNPVLF